MSIGSLVISILSHHQIWYHLSHRYWSLVLSLVARPEMEVSPGFVFKKSLVTCKSGHLGAEQPWRHFPPGAGAKWPQTIHSEARKRAPVGQRLKRRCRLSFTIPTNATDQGKLRRKEFEAPVKCSNFWVPMLRLQHLGINPSEWGIPDVILSHGGGTRHPKPFVLSTSVGDQKWVGCAGVFERKSGESEWLWSHFKCDVICLKAFTVSRRVIASLQSLSK